MGTRGFYRKLARHTKYVMRACRHAHKGNKTLEKYQGRLNQQNQDPAFSETNTLRKMLCRPFSSQSGPESARTRVYQEADTGRKTADWVLIFASIDTRKAVTLAEFTRRDTGEE